MTPRNTNQVKCVGCDLLIREINTLKDDFAKLTEQVMSQGKELISQGKKLIVQDEELVALKGTVLLDWIRNVIASILLVLAGEQPYPCSSSNRFLLVLLNIVVFVDLHYDLHQVIW